MSIERTMKQYELDRREAVKLAARLLLASGTTSPRVGGVGECTIHIVDDECGIEDLAQHVESMADENKAWKHGAFTQAVLESLRGESPQAGTLRITLNDVVSYVQAAVRKVTNGRQNPVAAPDEILPFTSLILAERLR